MSMKEISVLTINGEDYLITPMPSTEMAEAVEYIKDAMTMVASRRLDVISKHNTVVEKAAQVESGASRAENAREAAEQAAIEARNILNELGITGAYHGEYEVIE